MFDTPLSRYEPQFLRLGPEPRHVFGPVADIAEADTLQFWCPGGESYGGSAKDHPHYIPRISRWDVLAGYIDRAYWEFVGTGLHDLSLVEGSSSVKCNWPGCGAHFFVTNGMIADHKLPE